MLKLTVRLLASVALTGPLAGFATDASGDGAENIRAVGTMPDLQTLQGRAEQVKACADGRAAAGKFSGVVMVAFEGAPMASAAYGVADPEFGKSNTLETRFETGSMPKMFTAVALGQLVESGKVGFHDTLGQHLEGLPPEIARVTLHQALTHSSGLGNYLNRANVPVIQSATRAMDLVPAAVGTGLSFTPGSEWQYSNAGFVLVGAVVEQVSGQAFSAYVREHILTPAGMTETNLDGPTADSAIGLRVREGEPDPIPVKTPWTGRFSPAGGAFSTAADMTRFLEALRTDRLLRRETREVIWTAHVAGPQPQPPRPRRAYAYGYGFGVHTFGDDRVVGHNGGVAGFNAEVSLAPEAGWSIAVLSNFDAPAGGIMSTAARDIMSGLEPRDGACSGVDPALPPRAAPSVPAAG